MNHLDGNAAAGELSEIFRAELTSALATCAACGVTGAIATVRVYEAGLGTVLRCPRCDAVLARVVHAGEETRMEMQGVRVLRWRSAAP